jgi:tetratricopeptide (TPR) repeat protein
MSNRGNFRNVVGITLAAVLAVCWGFQENLKALVSPSVTVSPARRGITLMSANANDAQKRAEARADFDTALKGDAKDPVALFGLGWVEQLDGNRDRASELYTGSIVELQDLLHAARFNQSLVLEEKGDLRGAYEQVRLLLRVDPQHEKARARQEDLIRKMGSQSNNN